MTSEGRTFHESWYKIANQRISLSPRVRVQRQIFRGELWYVLHDPFSNQFFRLHPSSYEFIARLNKDRTVEEVWDEMILHNMGNAPGQEEVIHLLAQLYHANLLHYELAPDSVKLFERYKKRKQRILQANLMNIMFARIPLLDPDAFLKRILPLIRSIISPYGAVIWSIVVAAGLKIVIDNFADLQVQSQKILSPSNLLLLYAGLVIIKTLHEFGHASAVRRFGGEVHNMGVMFLIFSPLPYMDATAAWSFRSKWKRVFVSAAGIIVELFVAACALFVWVNTGSGVIHSLAYNIIFVASVSTIIFNANPLLRYDGYYILSDLLGIPNLYIQATKQLTYLVEKYAFGVKKAQSPATSKQELVLLTGFGVLSSIYRVVVFSAILFFIADRFLLAGIIMAVICAITWIVVPIVQLFKYLATNPRLDRVRIRASVVSIGVLSFVLGFLLLCPFPNYFMTPGVLKSDEYLVVVSQVNGTIDKIMTPSGKRVKPGDPLISMSNKELDFEIKQAEASVQEMQIMLQQAVAKKEVDIKPIESRLKAVMEQLDGLRHDKGNLIVHADIEGLWVSPEANNYINMWIQRGTPLGQIINDKAFYFSSVVPEQEVSRIFSDEIRFSQVKLNGQAATTIPVQSLIKIPMEHTTLPSAALGWSGGGDIPINLKDATGKTTAEPFFEVRANVGAVDSVRFLHDRAGVIKYELAMEPLLKQWWRKLRQLVQKRYQI